MAGNVYRSGKDLTLQRGGISGLSFAQFGGQIPKDPLLRCHHGLGFHSDANLNGTVLKPMQKNYIEGELCPSVSRQSIHFMNTKLQATTRFQCYSSLDHYKSSCNEQRASDELGLNKRKHPQIVLGRANLTRVYYKSEDYSEAEMNSRSSAEGTGEAILLEGNAQTFPKRWVIVLLCFAAFVLCNMDRVSIFLCLYFQLLIYPYISRFLISNIL